MNIKRLNSCNANFWPELDALLAWESVSDKAVNDTVTGIIADIRSRGDDALVEYTNRFDRMSVSDMGELEIPAERLQQALDSSAKGCGPCACLS